MRNPANAKSGIVTLTLLLLAAGPSATAQVPVDEEGNTVGAYETPIDAVETQSTLGNEGIPLLSDVELEDLVGPIALYPDDLLAIVLPASAYPLQIIEAARFLEELETDPSLKPDPEWDDSIVALLNYPEVVELLNEDIDWTWRLGEATIAQQGDVVSAIENFRDRAYAAGNLKSDDYQTVTRDEGVIEITPVAEDVIYVPYYEPASVVVYQPRPVYYYYPRSYPVYYYPYSSAWAFDRSFFWGVTTAFTIGWASDSLHVHHHSYHGHPYYGYTYWDRWWYRRPSVNVYNTTYVRNTNVTINRHYHGDVWQPRHDRPNYVRHERVLRNRHAQPRHDIQTVRARTERRQEPIAFRSRSAEERRVIQDQRVRSERRDPVARKRAERKEPVARKRADRQQPTVRQRSETNELVTRQRVDREQRATRQRAERRETAERQRVDRNQLATRQRNERSEPVAHQRVERRLPISREPVERKQLVARQRVERKESVVSRRTKQQPTRVASGRSERSTAVATQRQTTRAPAPRQSREQSRPAKEQRTRTSSKDSSQAANREERKRPERSARR